MKWITVLLLGLVAFSAQADSLADVSAALQKRLQEPRAEASVREFYQQRQFQPAWLTTNGPSQLSIDLLQIIQASWQWGLKPKNYHEALLAEKISQFKQTGDLSKINVDEAVQFEITATETALLLGAHQLWGYVKSKDGNTAQLVPLLAEAAQKNALQLYFAELQPKQNGYQRLREALVNYQAIQQKGGWPSIPKSGELFPGSQGPRVAALRQRLLVTDGFGDTSDYAGDNFDGDLEEMVKRFQARHGIEADGVVGAETLDALNVSVEERLGQIAVNLERWRWYPQCMAKRHIIVNVAAFELDLMEDDHSILNSRIIVGRMYRKTPMFGGMITHLIINPYWDVPPSIAVRDKLHHIQDNPDYLTVNNFKVYRVSDGKRVSVHSVPWNSLSARHFPYHLRQSPGPDNALGRIKFLFPNRFNVYLHDTPYHELFDRSMRAFSSGCVRVQKSLELAEILLKGEWSREKIDNTIERGRETRVDLTDPVPVHILYRTAWVDEQGVLNFRNDLYNRDEKIYNLLPQSEDIFAKR